MKKFFVTGATLLIALVFAAPSFAIEHKITGTLTFDGVLNHNPDLVSDSDAKRTVDYREMQLRIHTESKVNDNITLFTRFDILDKVLSSQYSNTVAGEDDDNIQFDHAWMQIISPIGLWRVGRKTGIKWGTDFFDDGDDYGTDRLEWILPLDVGADKFVIAVVGEKALETQTSNRDNEKFYATGTYVHNNFKTGLLVGYYDYKSFRSENGREELITTSNNYQTASQVDLTFSSTDIRVPIDDQYDYDVAKAAFTDAVEDYMPRAHGTVTYVAPYFSGKIGKHLTINAEYDYVSGEIEFKDIETGILTDVMTQRYYTGFVAAGAPLGPATLASAQAAAADFINQAYVKKKDVEMTGYWLEFDYEMGPSNVQLGYAFMSGDADGQLNDIENAGALAPGEDWEKLLILTSDDTGLDNWLGSLSDSLGNDKSGNILNRDSAMNEAGYNLFYLGGNYDVNESIGLGCIFGMATADKARSGWDDDYGMELDVSLSWKFLGNLEYNATAGYLMAGDFWKGGSTTTDVDDLFAFYHELVLSF